MTTHFHAAFACVILTAVFAGCVGSNEPSAEVAGTGVDGTWVDKSDPESKWVISGNKVTMHFPQSEQIPESVSEIAFDSSGEPKGVTLTDEDGARAAAYELNGDELVVWFHPVHNDKRPDSRWDANYPWIVRHFHRQQ